jgi:hypothetical protein
MIDWIKDHPYLFGGLLVGLLILFVLYRNAQSAAASVAAQSTGPAVSTGPDDTIQAAEIAAGTQVAQAQLAANQTVAGYNASINAAAIAAQSQNLQTSAGVVTNNVNTQAQLTLGLASAGQSTQSVLELLGAQPLASSVAQQFLTVSSVGPATPAPVAAPASPVTPVTTGSVTPITTGSVAPLGGTLQTLMNPITPPIPVTLPTSPTDPGQISDIYESDPTGENSATGQSYPLSPDYYATPSSAADFASILGLTTASTGPVGGVGVSGGPFSNPSAVGFNVSTGTPSGAGVANAGQVISQLQSTAPSEWANELAGYGISLNSSQENQIYQLFGSNQAVPEMSNDPTHGETQGSSAAA